MNCRDNKPNKYLDGDGLLFYTQALYNKINVLIDEEISKAVVQKTLAANPAIIEKINEMLENGELATKQSVDSNIAQLRSDIEQAKAAAVSDAVAQFNANIRALARQYAQEVLDEYEEEIDIDALAQQLLQDAAFNSKFVKKTGDTVAGNLNVQGNVTGEKFVTSSGIIFF